MECPVCGKTSELEIVTIHLDGDDLADFIFESLILKGYAPKMKEINTILDILDDYIIKGVLEDGESEGS